MAACVFCGILAGEIPAQKVHETASAAAILDINPVAPGHVLVMPRAHHETLVDLPPELAAELARSVQEVARGVLKATGAEGCNVLMNNRRCAGQAIDHAHIHVIPRRAGDGIKFNWPAKPAEPADLERMAATLRSALG